MGERRRAPTEPTGGRPREFDAAVVIEEAVDVFWRHGFRGTTTRGLAGELGMSQSSLYNTFGSKHDLQESVIDAYEARVATALLEPLDAEPDGVVGLRRFLHDLTAWVTDHDHGGCMVINLMSDEPGRFSERTARYRQRVRGGLRRALERATTSSTVDDEQVAMRTEALFGQVLAINLLARTGDGDEVRAQLAAALATLPATSTDVR